jgi:antibiotic biosynthesis monooxygenase (ABM) superfamily enzyme
VRLPHTEAETACFQRHLIKGENIMATMLVQQHVKDFAAWKKVYDSVADLRASLGAISDQIYRDASDPNTLTIVFKWDSLANAQKWGGSPDLKAAMEKAGVEGLPVISYLNEA